VVDYDIGIREERESGIKQGILILRVILLLNTIENVKCTNSVYLCSYVDPCHVFRKTSFFCFGDTQLLLYPKPNKQQQASQPVATGRYIQSKWLAY
jgi:hypothetical protein